MVFAVIYFIIALVCLPIAIYGIKKTMVIQKDNLSQEERKKLKQAEEMFKYGQLSLLEYNALKAKYTGEKSMIEEFGLDVAVAASNMHAADKAVEMHQKEAEKKIIKNAAVGNAVGGVAGSVAFAASTAQKESAEAQKLRAEQEKAQAEYEAALRRSVK